MADSSTVDVATYPTKTEAEFAASVLQTNDIEAFVQAGGTGGEQVGAPTISGFTVFVASDQAVDAKGLLAGVYPEDDLTHKPFSERGKEGAAQLSSVPNFIAGIFVGALLVGAVLAAQSYKNSHYSGTRFYGDVKEKKRGTWDVFESGQLVRRQFDRNYDGKPDLTMYFKGKELQRVEYDDNFDGQTDMWFNYEEGNPAEAQVDTDFNGVSDEAVFYQNGVKTRLECRPNGVSNPIRKEFYENGVKVRQLDHPDASGQLTREITYDAFGNEALGKKAKSGA